MARKQERRNRSLKKGKAMSELNRQRFNRHSLFIGLVLVAAVVSSPADCQASHPYHVSHAEVNWNAKSGNFEVALCVWPADLEKALKVDVGRSIDLDEVENLDLLLESYVGKKFRITSGGGQADTKKPTAAKIRWVGHERDLKKAWLYFEISGDKAIRQWKIENRVFFELNEDQLNHVDFKHGNTAKVVISRLGQVSHPIDILDQDQPESVLGAG